MQCKRRQCNKSRRIKAAIVAVGVAAAIFGINASSAIAGTYAASQCDGGTGAGLSPQFSAYQNGSWGFGNLCPSGVALAGNGLWGNFTSWRMITPAGLTIDSVTFGGQGNAGTTSTRPALFAMLCYDTGAPTCSWGDYENLVVGPSQHTLVAPGSVSFLYSMGSGCCVQYASNAYTSIWNLGFILRDEIAPTAGGHTGNLIVNDWNRGNKTGGTSSSDGQSGVKNLLAVVDSNPVGPGSSAYAPTCSSNQIVPCPTNPGAWNPTIATQALADGSHTLRYVATDNGNNTASSTTYNFKVDNTQPDVPTNVQIPGLNGWNSANDFDLTWTNATEDAETATKSGIAAVKVDVDPAIAGPTNPAAMTIAVGTTVGGVSATRSSLSNLSVPGIGSYQLKLSVIDKAGNESPVGDGSNGAVDGVFSIGYDPNPPAAPQGQANGWISRAELAGGYVQQWTVVHPQNAAPICGYAKSITPAPADPGTTMNLSGAVNSMVLPTNLTEGPHSVNLRSINCSCLASLTKESVDAPVDLTDPTGSITGVEDGQWYKDNQNVHLAGVDSLSGMAPSTTFVPDGAYLSYTLNGGAEQLVAGGSGDFAVTGEGAKELSFAPVDFAGNKANAKVVRFGVDASDPTGGFNAPDPNRPTLLSAPVKDAVSGIALATIQVHNHAGGDWITLPTSIADTAGNAVSGYPKDANVSARFPDTQLPIGTYKVRLTGVDRAGNTLSTSRRTDGSEMTLTNPMREAVVLSAGLSKAKRTCQKKKGVMCVKEFRGKVVFSSTYQSLSVGFKRGAVVQGFLTTSLQGRLARQPVEIYAKAKGKAEVLLGTTSTRFDGSYVFKIMPGVSRTIRVYYPGTELREDASATVQLGTAAKLTMRISKRHARTGQTVTFFGKVRSFDGSIPAAGKIVALQFYAGKKWRPAVAIAHTDSKGNFKVKYKFDGAKVKARIVFRVIAPTEDGWVHATSASRRIILRLN